MTNITYTTEGEVKTATATYDHNGATYTFTDTYTLPLESLELRDNASNEETLENYGGRKVNTLTLSGRTLYGDGSWNTLCLPFDLSQEEISTQLTPSALKTLGTSSFDSTTGVLTLNFTDATSIEAGKPYLIKWTSGEDRKNPLFSNVTINIDDKAVITDDVTFAGSFSPFSLEANDRSALFLGADNTLYYPSADMTVGSCRAVFKLNGITAGDHSLSAGVRGIMLNFDDETTGIQEVIGVNEVGEVSDDSWYSLDGRRLNGKPTQKGIYINHGNKVVIK